ncbi:hypothetical protein MEX01_19150 [Methylorubrum extorquens]|uniref:hypothetical protein n=1 Tax=Methylorubrum extorquens TaxID=408 RepID=UPI001173D6D9|nr:hypothetical protein [Methylorubrum extorquens]GEL41324.1 hypothetical protein MEX01_19150 [Methylorubrum extorquens]
MGKQIIPAVAQALNRQAEAPPYDTSPDVRPSALNHRVDVWLGGDEDSQNAIKSQRALDATMSKQLVKRRVAIALLSGVCCGLVALGTLWLLWAPQLAPLPPVAVALAGVLGSAGGAFSALFALSQTKSEQSRQD